MKDVKLEMSDEKEAAIGVLNTINAEVQTIMSAVPVVDLRALSRLQYGTIRKKITGPILKKCIGQYLHADFKLKQTLLDLLKTESDNIEVDVPVKG